MKIEEGPWRGWEVWLEYVDGVRLPEHGPKYTLATRHDGAPSECVAEVTVECQHERDFKVVVQPGQYKPRWFSVLPSVDGQPVQSYFYSQNLSNRCEIDHKLEVVDGKTFERSLSFSSVLSVEELPAVDQRAAADTGVIGVRIEAGEAGALSSYNPTVTPAPRALIDEKLKKISLTSCVTGTLKGRYLPRPIYDFTRDLAVPAFLIRFNYATRDAIKVKEQLAAAKSAADTIDPTTGRSSGRTGTTKHRAPPTHDASHSSEDDDDITIVENPSPRKRRKCLIDLTNDDKPPVFIDLTQVNGEEEAGPSSAKLKAGPSSAKLETEASSVKLETGASSVKLEAEAGPSVKAECQV